jgi:cell division protein YceG involved in septum cleavage
LKSLLFKLIGLGVFVTSLAVGAGWKYLHTLLSAQPKLPEQGLVIDIKPGDNYYLVTDQLSELGLAPGRFWNRLIAFNKPELTDFKAAE